MNASTDPNTPAGVKRALAAILADERFTSSPQMSAFLGYVVKRKLEGDGVRVKAYTIGVEALGKPETFDPQTDPSVRVLAKRLRTSLVDYHRRHPEADPVIEIRSGCYQPLFIDATEAARNALADPATRRLRPSRPVIRMVESVASDRLHKQLMAVASGVMARSEIIQVTRRMPVSCERWPEHYELSMETVTLVHEHRIEMQLVHASDGGIVQATTIHCPLAPDDDGNTAEAILTNAAIATAERFAASLVQKDGALLQDYRRRGSLAPYMVRFLSEPLRKRPLVADGAEEQPAVRAPERMQRVVSG